MLELSSKPKEPKPPKEKKVYYSSRGGAGRSKSAGPVARKPLTSNAPSRILEVPVPTNKTTSTGRGGSANARTFVVEEGTFERVMDVEAGTILAIKTAEKRRTMNLRGGSAIPMGKEKKKERSPTATQLSGEFSEDETSSKSTGIVSRFPRVPSFNSAFFTRERPPSPASFAPSQDSSRPSVTTGNGQAPAGRHCPTCQCWRHTASTQLSLEMPPTTPAAASPPPSPFKAVFPGVLLYVPEDSHSSYPPTGPTSHHSLQQSPRQYFNGLSQSPTSYSNGAPQSPTLYSNATPASPTTRFNVPPSSPRNRFHRQPPSPTGYSNGSPPSPTSSSVYSFYRDAVFPSSPDLALSNLP